MFTKGNSCFNWFMIIVLIICAVIVLNWMFQNFVFP